MELTRVITIENAGKEMYEHFQDWGDDTIGPQHIYDSLSDMYVLRSHYPQLCALRSTHCSLCPKAPKFSSVKELQKHYQQTHQKMFCSLCLANRKQFIQEQKLYSKTALQNHMSWNDIKGGRKMARDGFEGHPRCDFCKTQFYSLVELYDHVRHHHFECDICLRHHHIENRYYKDYLDLQNHFRMSHYLCEEPGCLEKKFVVFPNEVDYQAHMGSDHPGIRISRKLNVHFNVKRAERDGAGRNNDAGEEASTAFSSLSLSHSEPVIDVADFPSLTSMHTGPTLSRWSTISGTMPRGENFPALQSSTSAGNRGFRDVLAPRPTPGMYAHMSNSDPWSYPEFTRAADALGSNNPLMRFVKAPKRKKKGKRMDTAVKEPKPLRQADVSEQEEKPREQLVENEVSEELKPAERPPSKSATALSISQKLGSPEKYEVFRISCRQFSHSELEVDAFYKKICPMFNAEDFEVLVCRLIEFMPHSDRRDLFFEYHRLQKEAGEPAAKASQARGRNTSRNVQAQSGWAAILFQLSTSAVPRQQSSRRDTARPSYASSTMTPPSEEVSRNAVKPPPAPPQSFAAITLHERPAPTRATPVPAPKSQFKSSKSEFPELPKAAHHVGVEAVTRATWDEQLHRVVERSASQHPSDSTKKIKGRKKKKSTTLGGMAMKYG
uniref:Uncharacterized protein AlNc14C181G8216 n=1 Tax=Albugo laibachii Nc14 TaxID=890382 RepID=F0WP68_9STRA|nr:conserved hypothetical protein [Albugo laibachii Nc14]|eukprot:CCA23114.1 conserved hypothetical protein [Albugo laibachii Nc14]